MSNKISVVIGSYGSYNSGNEKSLGSEWLVLNNYSCFDEILHELRSQGFDLDGIDNELFVQDIEGIECSQFNWNNSHPQLVFETLYDTGVLSDCDLYDKMCAFIECRSFDDFMQFVDNRGYSWDNDIVIWQDYSWSQFGREMFEQSNYNIPDCISWFIDYEQYGRHIGGDYAEEYSQGIIEIY